MFCPLFPTFYPPQLQRGGIGATPGINSSWLIGVCGNLPGIGSSLMVITLLEVLTWSRPGRVENSVAVVVAFETVVASVMLEAVGANPDDG